jgi:ABC-type phosphate transport system permease subunit
MDTNAKDRHYINPYAIIYVLFGIPSMAVGILIAKAVAPSLVWYFGAVFFLLAPVFFMLPTWYRSLRDRIRDFRRVRRDVRECRESGNIV